MPIKAAKEVAEKYNQMEVVMITWDGRKTHVVTYGKDEQHCKLAAHLGNLIKRGVLGWPEELCNEKPRSSKRKSKTDGQL